ncbi:hypothetical protein BN1723_019514, partial [Verticillium longisporum]
PARCHTLTRDGEEHRRRSCTILRQEAQPHSCLPSDHLRPHYPVRCLLEGVGPQPRLGLLISLRKRRHRACWSIQLRRCWATKGPRHRSWLWSRMRSVACPRG